MGVRIPGGRKPGVGSEDIIGQFYDMAARIPILILVNLLGLIPIVGQPIAATLAGFLRGTNDTAQQALSTTVSVTTQVTHIQQVIAAPTGVGLWETGPDPTGIVSFPFSQLAMPNIYHRHTAIYGASEQFTGRFGLVATTGSSTTIQYRNALTGPPAQSPDITSVTANAGWAPWSAIRSPGAAQRRILTFIARGGATTFGADLYRMTEDGGVALVASTTENYAADLTGQWKFIQIVLPAEVAVEEADVIWVQWRVTGGSVEIAGINLPIPTGIDGFYPKSLAAGRNPSSVPSPSTIDTATFAGMAQGMTAWVSFGLDVGQADIPKFHFDDFNRSSLGGQYLTGGTHSVRPRITSGYVELQTDLLGTSRRGYALTLQSMRSDAMSVEADVNNTSGRAAGLGACLDSAAAGVWLIVTTDFTQICTGGYASYTVRAGAAVGGPGHYKLAYDADTASWVATKNGEDIGLTWAESGVTHGKSYRRCGLSVLSTSSASARIDNFICQDIPEEE